MPVVQASLEDLPQIIDILKKGRQLQIDSGNLNQWSASYPDPQLIQKDIQKGASYLYTSPEGEIWAVFCLMKEAEPTYSTIAGEWLNDTDPYVTIHRLATAQIRKGMGEKVLRWVIDHNPNVRIDTHEDNATMRHIIKKLGFKRCGVIYLENGDPRIAYQYLS